MVGTLYLVYRVAGDFHWLCGRLARRGMARQGSGGGFLPAEFGEAAVVYAEVVGDLVDDGPADLVGDLLLGAADRADRQAVDRDLIGQHACVLGCSAGEGDALVEAEQSRRAWLVLDRHGDVAHQAAEFGRQPVQGGNHHLLETGRLNLDHKPIVQRGADILVARGARASGVAAGAGYLGTDALDDLVGLVFGDLDELI